MNKNTNVVLNVLKILLFIVLALLLVFAFFNQKTTETNILKAILSDSPKDELLIDLSQKHSGKFSVIFESKDIETVQKAKKEFEDNIPVQNFLSDTSKNIDFREILNTYKYYNTNLLSQKTARQIQRYDFEPVKLEAVERLYNPMSINILPIEEDPFMLFGDFLQSLGSGETSGITKKNGVFYDISNYQLKEETSLSPSVLNKKISTIIKLKTKIEKDNKNLKIYLAGAPIHTFYASSKSMKEINLICILSSIFIILLCKFYFKSFKILVPISISLFIGILSGYLLTSALFNSIHILTFVFSTTLIGICIDYSLHFFAHDNDIMSVFKSLTVSMLTTVCAFLILLFSNIQLLQQIAVFTAAGLFSVYLFVVLFYPLICRYGFCELDKKADLSEIFGRYKFSLKTKKILLLSLVIAALIGIFQIHFNDEIKDMYTPPKHLVYSENLFSELSDRTLNTAFLIIKGSDTQNLLEKEEKALEQLDTEKYVSLSRFVPSIKQQKINRKLRKLLYEKEMNNYANFLDKKSREKLLNDTGRQGFLTIEKLPIPILKDFFAGPSSSIVILQNPDSKAIKNVLAENPEVSYIDLKNDISKKVSSCRKTCLALFLPITLFLFVFLAFIFKPLNALKIIAPSLLGSLFSFGMLGLFQQSVNLFHVLALFLITGFSLDYSIFRFNSSKNLNASNDAVFISCATSAFSFLLLSMTSFKLVSSLGFVLSLGLISSYIFSLLLISKDDLVKQPSQADVQTDRM